MSNPQLNTLVPNSQAPIGEVKDKSGKVIGSAFITLVWASFFQQFTQKAPAVQDVTISGSPFEYTPNNKGIFVVTGGTISNLSLIRGTVTINLTGQKIIPVSIGDTLSITYSIVPTSLQFLPS